MPTKNNNIKIRRSTRSITLVLISSSIFLAACEDHSTTVTTSLPELEYPNANAATQAATRPNQYRSTGNSSNYAHSTPTYTRTTSHSIFTLFSGGGSSYSSSSSSYSSSHSSSSISTSHGGFGSSAASHSSAGA